MAPRRLPTLPDPDAPVVPPAVAQSVTFQLMQLAGRFRSAADAVMQAHRVHPRQYMLLQVLRAEGTLSQQAVGQRAGLDRTTTMQATLGLVEAGLVTRQDDPRDRRVYRLALTPEGEALVGTLAARMQDVEQTLLSGLAPEARTAFLAALPALLAFTADMDRWHCDHDG